MSPKKLTKTDINLTRLIKKLKDKSRTNGVKIWKDIALRLTKPHRIHPEVNVYKLDRNTTNNDTVLIPGNVLGVGSLSHKLTVSAFHFTETAKKKITQAKGKCIPILELAEINPKGSNVKIMG